MPKAIISFIVFQPLLHLSPPLTGQNKPACPILTADPNVFPAHISANWCLHGAGEEDLAVNMAWTESHRIQKSFWTRQGSPGLSQTPGNDEYTNLMLTSYSRPISSSFQTSLKYTLGYSGLILSIATTIILSNHKEMNVIKKTTRRGRPCW